MAKKKKKYKELDRSEMTLDQLAKYRLLEADEQKKFEWERVKKGAFLEEFSRTFNISKACLFAGIRRNTYLGWRETDRSFDELAREIEEQMKDDAEEVLMENIRENHDVVSTIFLLKTRAKDRGYIEKTAGDNIFAPVIQLTEEQARGIAEAARIQKETGSLIGKPRGDKQKET